MPSLLAIDWDRREVRCLLATAGSGRVKVQEAWTAPTVLAEGGDGAPDLAESLRGALAGHRVGGAVVLVAVDRGSVEMIQFTIPPAGDAELPELILNQVLREVPAAGDDAAVNYVMAEGDPAQPRQVTAAVLPAAQLKQIRDLCAEAKLKPRRLVLRPYATAELFAAQAPTAGACLLVSVAGDEADLVVLVDNRPVLLRTVRLPGRLPEEKTLQRLSGEVQRTLALGVDDPRAAAGIAAVHLCGDAQADAALAQRIAEDCHAPVTLFDAFRALGTPDDRIPADAKGFAALLGIVQAEGRGAAHTIDFLRPLRRVKEQRWKRMAVLGGGGLLILAIVGGWNLWDALSSADAQNRALSKRAHELSSMLKRIGEQQKAVEAVHDWQAGDVTWLDELRDLSIRFPSGRDMVLTNMAMTSAGRAGGGEIAMRGVVRDQSIVLKMESGVRDKFHVASSKRIWSDPRPRTYAWHFDTAMSVGRRDKTQFTSHLPGGNEPPPAATPAAPATSNTTAAGDTAKPPLETVKPASAESIVAGDASKTPPAAVEPSAKTPVVPTAAPGTGARP